MKTKFTAIGASLALALLALGSLPVHAGPGAQYWQSLNKKANVPADPMAACDGCKTKQITELRHVGGYSKATPGTYYRVAVGAAHTCKRCGGEIAIISGKTTDTMLHGCANCGPDAARCMAAATTAAKS